MLVKINYIINNFLLGIYDHSKCIDFLKNNEKLLFITNFFYLTTCFIGPKIMKNISPFNLKKSLFIWNSFLSIFSLFGSYNMIYFQYNLLNYFSYRDTICNYPDYFYQSNSLSLWSFLFTISKIFELNDTLFLILRKRKIIFLHWYHHSSVLLVTWNSFIFYSYSFNYFMSMNFSIHTLMYAYYALKSINICPSWFPSYILTYLQILQMIIGGSICLSNWYYYIFTQNCYSHLYNLILLSFIYFTYLLLFVDFFNKRYKKLKNE